MTNLENMGIKAKKAARQLAVASTQKDTALANMALALIDNTDKILAANLIDTEKAKQNGMSASLIDRLTLSAERIKDMAKGITEVSAWSDPVGKVLDGKTLVSGLKTKRVTVPLGVIGIIYESRPNVTSDAAALCLKSGNAVILRGGKEAYNSSRIITDVICYALEKSGLDRNCVQLVDDTSRQSALDMMNLTGYLDVLIPRGGAGLIRTVVENSKVPVIETGVGNCHIYVDKSADIDMAVEIVFNAKTSRPSVCNAIETILVHRDISKKALPLIKARLDEKNVEIRGCEETQKIISCKKAEEADWATEFVDYILAVKIVNSIDEATDHIDKYSSHHSEAIITDSQSAAEQFTAMVDSACVYVNASTRFTDGGEMGLGAEIGISTQKLHARGPMGLDQLVSYKYIITGNGQVR